MNDGNGTQSKAAKAMLWAGLGASYFCYFGFLGTLQPYLTMLYLEHGLPAAVVGSSVALLYVLAGATPLLASWAAVRWQLETKALFLFCCGSALALAVGLCVATTTHVRYVLGLALLTAIYAPLNALLDTAALKACSQQDWSFGRIRLMGSLGYIATATGMGRILPTTAVSNHVHVAMATLLAAVFLAGWLLPRARMASDVAGQAPSDASSQLAIGLRPAPWVLGCLVAALGLHYASFGPFQYGFTLYGRSVGLSPAAIGVGWSLGVASEVGFFSLAGKVLARFGWPVALGVAFVAAPLRWSLLALLPSPTTFFVTQLLHGPGFALFYAASMAALEEVVPEVRARKSQTLFCALVAGLASGPAMLLAGYAYAYMSLASMFACLLPANLLSALLLFLALRGRTRENKA